MLKNNSNNEAIKAIERLSIALTPYMNILHDIVAEYGAFICIRPVHINYACGFGSN